MTVNAKQAEELFALAKENGVILTEATWTRYMPFVAALQEVLQQGVIGTPLSMKCSFGFPVSDRPRMAQPELAGGALLDLGIYPLTMAAIAFGTDIVEMTSACTKLLRCGCLQFHYLKICTRTDCQPAIQYALYFRQQCHHLRRERPHFYSFFLASRRFCCYNGRWQSHKAFLPS